MEMDNYVNENDQFKQRDESIPINTAQPNYNSSDSIEVNAGSITDIEQKLNGYCATDLPYVPDAQKDLYALIWKYSEQLKSISAGLLLLFCGGMHTVWSIYQLVFFEDMKKIEQYVQGVTDKSNKTDNSTHIPIIKLIFSNKFGLQFVIINYYVGVILGCLLAGYYLVPRMQKKSIYYLGTLPMFVCGCLFYSVSVSDPDWQVQLLFGRFFAGFSHGMVCATIWVHATENAANEFRSTLVTVIGGTIGLSIFITSTVLIYIPLIFKALGKSLKEEMKESEITSAGTISVVTFICCFLSVVVNYFFTHETVPFMLAFNHRAEEATFTLGKLNDADMNSAEIQNEFETIREMCTNDYAEFEENKIFTTSHRELLSIALYGRLAGLGSFNVPGIVVFTLVLQWYFAEEILIDVTDLAKSTDKDTAVLDLMSDVMEKLRWIENAVKIVLFVWFVFGLGVTLLANKYNLRHFLHCTTLVIGAVSVLTSFVRPINFLFLLVGPVFLILFVIYSAFFSMPADIVGYSYLMDCFPASTRARSIAFIIICENVVHILLIFIDFHPRSYSFGFLLIALLVFFVAFKLYSIPDTTGMPLPVARRAYLQARSGKRWWQIQ